VAIAWILGYRVMLMHMAQQSPQLAEAFTATFNATCMRTFVIGMCFDMADVVFYVFANRIA
jgi:hypothetical protein